MVGSLTIGTTFFLSPVSGILTDKIGLRTTTFIGGVLATSGMLLSAIFHGQINVLYITYGIMFGFGAALAYTPTLAILGHYYKSYLGIVSGFVTSGSSIFTAWLPMLLKYVLDTYGFQTNCCMLGLFSSIVILCALVYKPRLPPPPPIKRKPGQSSADVLIKSLVNVDNWKKKRYVIWALSIPVALIGYFVPYVHMAKYVTDKYPGANENTPIMCIGITSGLGRLVFGYLADYKGINRIGLQQFAFVMIGLCTMAIPFSGSYTMLIVIALAMGVVDGCFISLLGPIAYGEIACQITVGIKKNIQMFCFSCRFLRSTGCHASHRFPARPVLHSPNRWSTNCRHALRSHKVVQFVISVGWDSGDIRRRHDVLDLLRARRS